MRATSLLLLLSLLVACEGGLHSVDNEDRAPAPEAPVITPEAEARKPHGPALNLDREQIVLLPFQVRLNKLAAVLQVSTEDAALAEVRAQRYELGDHDYARGIRPDLAWSAQRMARWVRAVKPVCASEAMRARYPALPEHLNELTIAAYGREAEQADLELVEEITASLPLADEPTRYRALCLAFLSSAEFVAQ